MNNVDLRAAAKALGTPSYIFHTDMLSGRVRAIRSIAADSFGLCYAIKANPFLTREMSELTDRLEVCSPGELEICIAEGVAPEKLLISGVNKTAETVERALDYGVRLFTAESVKHIRLLQSAAEEKRVSLGVFLRLSSGSQFGMDESDLRDIVREREAYTRCKLLGLHYFVGTQRGRLRQHEKELVRLRELMLSLREDYGFAAQELEYGPGLYYPYFQNEEEDDLSLFREFTDLFASVGVDCKTTVEMGRYFAAECGFYLTAVNDAKLIKKQLVAVLDGGIHQLSYYGGAMGMFTPRFDLLKSDGEEREKNEWMLCGSLCTTSDILVRCCETEELRENDILVFKNAGAYSMTEGLSLFLSRELPTVALYKNGQLIIKREATQTHPFNH